MSGLKSFTVSTTVRTASRSSVLGVLIFLGLPAIYRKTDPTVTFLPAETRKQDWCTDFVCQWLLIHFSAAELAERLGPWRINR